MTDSIEHNQNFDLKKNNQKTQPLSLGFLYVFFPLFQPLVLLFEH
ncbi:hypothetical protein VVMO6_02408 [Vibrio vulnificus MO6-24/O]|nr:hypothetical protein VVMO6_02408 [Vibrio vulnificus MO6-24/O]